MNSANPDSRARFSILTCASVVRAMWSLARAIERVARHCCLSLRARKTRASAPFAPFFLGRDGRFLVTPDKNGGVGTRDRGKRAPIGESNMSRRLIVPSRVKRRATSSSRRKIRAVFEKCVRLTGRKRDRRRAAGVRAPLDRPAHFCYAKLLITRIYLRGLLGSAINRAHSAARRILPNATLARLIVISR